MQLMSVSSPADCLQSLSPDFAAGLPRIYPKVVIHFEPCLEFAYQSNVSFGAKSAEWARFLTY
jgi:hypothetical protein